MNQQQEHAPVLTQEEAAQIWTMLEGTYLQCSQDLPKKVFLEYWPDIPEESSSSMVYRLYGAGHGSNYQPDGVSAYQAMVFCFLCFVLAAEGELE
jgi:hypothetical protein